MKHKPLSLLLRIIILTAFLVATTFLLAAMRIPRPWPALVNALCGSLLALVVFKK